MKEMSKTVIHILVACFLCCQGNEKINLGREFYLAFLRPISSASFIPSILLVNLNTGNVTVNISCPIVNFSEMLQVSALDTVVIILPDRTTFNRTEANTTEKVFKVQVLTPLMNIAVSGITQQNENIEIFSVIPVHFLGHLYYPATICPGMKHYITVIWIDTNSSGVVNFTLPVYHGNVEILTYGGVFYKGGNILSIGFHNNVSAVTIWSSYDLTGTEVFSDRPVGVFSGCDKIKRDHSGDYYLQTKQSAPPATNSYNYFYFGRHYIVASQSPNHSLRIGKVVNGTTKAIIKSNGGCNELTLDNSNPWKYVILDPYTTVTEVISDNPVIVVHIFGSQQPLSYNFYEVPTEQWASEYIVVIPRNLMTSGYEATLILYIENGHEYDLLFNSYPLHLLPNITWAVDESLNLVLMEMSVTTDWFKLSHLTNTSFGGYVKLVNPLDHYKFIAYPFSPVYSSIVYSCSPVRIHDNCIVEENNCTVITTTSQYPTTTSDMNHKCPSFGFWVTSGDQQICYWVITTSQRVDISEELCNTDNGTLGLVPDLNINQQLLSYIQSNEIKMPVWIGYKTLVNDSGTYIHDLDGNPQGWNYLENDIHGNLLCVQICKNTGLWCSRNCNNKRRALCYNGQAINAATGVFSTTISEVFTELNVQTEVTATLTYPEVTTQSEPTTAKGIAQCFCECTKLTMRENLTQEDVTAMAEEIRKALQVDKSSLSSAKRSKISAEDSRPSSTYVGSIGIILLSLVLCGIFVMDFPTIIPAFKHLFAK